MPGSRRIFAALLAGAAIFAALVLAAPNGAPAPRAAPAAPGPPPAEPVAAGEQAPSSTARRRRPNIVLITSDDQPLSTFQRAVMPRTFRQLVDRGTNFSDAVVNVPLCCPSRSTLLTGQYPHNHGVLTNVPGYGSLLDPRNVLPIWLQRAGYRTGHVGKWLHGYEDVRGTRPAPGWDTWYTQLKRRRYYDYKLSKDGRVINKGGRRRDHVTSVMTRAASRFVDDNVGSRKPLYLQLDYFAPHIGPRFSDGETTSRCIGAPEPSPKDRRSVREGGAPRGPSFNEEDVDDKPEFAQFAPLAGDRLASLDRRYRCTLESVAGLDRGIGRVIERFEQAGELGNTAFIFLTDNGFFFGEHRVPGDKARPWEEAIRTPLVMRLPKRFRTSETEVGEQVAAIDVAPTILQLAGADPCRPADGCRALDGRSLVAPARGKTDAFRDRAVLVEMSDPSRERRSFACSFQALRTAETVFVENTSFPAAETRRCEDGLLYEHYDIATDPFQLENLIGPGEAPESAEQRELLARLDRLRNCSGLEGRDPATPGGFCE